MHSLELCVVDVHSVSSYTDWTNKLWNKWQSYLTDGKAQSLGALPAY